MVKARQLTRVTLIALALVQCDKVEPVTFSYNVGVLDDNTAPEEFEAAVDCEPLDKVMPYPLFNRLGITQIGERPDGKLFARDDDNGTYLLDGETWQRLHVYMNFPDNDEVSEVFEWNVFASTQDSDLTWNWDLWYPPKAEPFFQLTTERIRRGDLINTADSARAQQPPNDPSEVSPNDFLWRSIVWYSWIVSDGGLHRHGYGTDATEEISADSQVADWWTAVFGSSRYDFVAVGGVASGPGAVTRNIAEATAAADSVKGRITRFSYYLDESDDWNGGEHDNWEGIDFDNPPDVPLADVFGVSAFDFWVVGNALSKTCPRVTGEVFHCNDTRCAVSARVPGAFLKSIHGKSGSDFYVVGGNDEQNAGAVILHYKNGEWDEIDTPADVPLNRVWVAPWDTVYAVGGAYSTDGTPSSVALVSEGEEWKVLELGAEMPLYNVYGPSKGDVHLVGEEGFFHYPDVRKNDPADIAAADICYPYCRRLLGESQNETLWMEQCMPNCMAWITESMSISPACHHGISALMQCINQSSYDDGNAFLSDPTAEESACVAEYANVHCDAFTLVTDLADPEK